MDDKKKFNTDTTEKKFKYIIFRQDILEQKINKIMANTVSMTTGNTLLTDWEEKGNQIKSQRSNAASKS